jgi:hypothetical protein
MFDIKMDERAHEKRKNLLCLLFRPSSVHFSKVLKNSSRDQVSLKTIKTLGTENDRIIL